MKEVLTPPESQVQPENTPNTMYRHTDRQKKKSKMTDEEILERLSMYSYSSMFLRSALSTLLWINLGKTASSICPKSVAFNVIVKHKNIKYKLL